MDSDIFGHPESAECMPSTAVAVAPEPGKPTKAEAQNQRQATQARVTELLKQEETLYGNGVQAILAYAHFIEAVHNELKGKKLKIIQYDAWVDFKSKCKGGKSTVSKCLTIASHPIINDPKYLQHLPDNRAALYELSALAVPTFKAAVKSSTITAQMGQRQAHQLCIDLGVKQHAPKANRVVRANEAESTKRAVSNHSPTNDDDTAAEDNGEDEDGPESKAALRTPPARPHVPKAIAPPNAEGTKDKPNGNAVIYVASCRCVKFDVREPLRNDMLALLCKYDVRHASVEINDPV